MGLFGNSFFDRKQGHVFRITPKRRKQFGNIIITPDMPVTITTPSSTYLPVAQYRNLVIEAYMRIYDIDITIMHCGESDFDVETLG